MSEAEKSTEVEDVLSSIRRLVALRDRATSENSEPVRVNEPPLTANNDIAPDQINKSNSFVEKMNASIAEIKQNKPESGPEINVAPDVSDEAKDIDETEDREAHVEAFLASAFEPELEKSQKPAPFVLSSEMAAKPDVKEEDAVKETDKIAIETVEAVQLDELALDDTESVLITEDDSSYNETIVEETPATESEQYIDEDILREIVSELVRNELQGDLGDRITRNVRKLVRREIHHALATRDL